MTDMGRQLAMIDYIAHEFGGKPVVGAEIGVFRGEGSEYILQKLNIEKLHLIDPYDYEDENYRDLARPNLQGASQEAQERLQGYSDVIQWWWMTSDAAAPLITDSLDFVYIDGNHYAELVKGDIENYAPKVKPGGFVGGHDYALGDVYVSNELYLMEDGEPIQIEVKPVVDAWIELHGYYLFVAGDHAFPDWWVQV